MIAPLLQVSNATVRYGGFTAVENTSLAIQPGEIFGLVGESGSGKTSLARAIIGEVRLAGGTISLGGHYAAPQPLSFRTRQQRRLIQLVQQDPYSSLNPRLTVRAILRELLRLHKIVPRYHEETRMRELMEQVGMPADSLNGYPSQFSGGQRQRIAIARALAVEPVLIVADEPTSALDVSIQVTVLNLFKRLRQERGLSMLFISHDLAVIHHMCDRLAVMQHGQIVETGPVSDFFAQPQHPYSRQLLDAVPRLNLLPEGSL